MREIIDCRTYVIVNLNDRMLVARYLLRELSRDVFRNRDVDSLLKYVFRCQRNDERYALLVAYLMLSKGRAVSDRTVERSPDLAAFYRVFHDWVVACLVGGRQLLPPVDKTFAMAFVSDVLDRAEGHLFGVRALPEAARVSVVRGMSDAVFQRRNKDWVLSASFIGAVGHFVYTAALLELQKTRKITGQEIRLLSKHSDNEYLKRFFDPLMMPQPLADTQYVEVTSARKRHYMADGRWATMSELVSEAARIWAEGQPFMTVDAETRARGDAALAALGVRPEAPIVTLHVREAGYHGKAAAAMSLRDARIADYRMAIAHLADTGASVIRLGDRSMTPAEPQAALVDYPFTDAKADWMDAYLASRCRFHIGTSSGMSFVPLLFGRPVLFTNWVTLSHMVCAPSVVTLPKRLLDAGGRTVPLAEYCTLHGHILDRTDATLHGLSFRDNTPEDLLDAVRLMDDHIDGGSGRLNLEPGLFDASQAVFAASMLKIRPQIPPAFWRAHYAGRRAVR